MDPLHFGAMMKEYDPVRFERGYGSGFQRFQDLMSYRVHDILLVSSIYDSFILEEDGRLDEGLIHEYIGLNLVHLPRMTRASSASQRAPRSEAGSLPGSVLRSGTCRATRPRPSSTGCGGNCAPATEC